MIDHVVPSIFFAGLRERRAAFRETFAYFAPQLAPRFNAFAFLRPNEVALSEIIAFLMNPVATHDQGSTFLNCFIAMVNEQCPAALIQWPSDPGNVEVKCESRTDRIDSRSRRMDIEIGFDGCGIAIENKPWAADGVDQLKDYWVHMTEKYATCWLVYLTRDGSTPDTASLPATDRESLLSKGRYIEISYGFVRTWLHSCESLCKADRVRHFVRDFKIYCDEQFLGAETMVDAKLVLDYSMRDENLELALVVAQQSAHIKDELLKSLFTQLREKLKERMPSLRMDVMPPLGYAKSKRQPIVFSKENWSSLTVAFEFDSTDCRDLAYGVRRRVETALPHFVLDLPRVNESTNQAGLASLRWPWWAWFASRDWYTNVSPWLAVQDGTMARDMIDCLEILMNGVEEAIDAAETADIVAAEPPSPKASRA